MTPDLDQVFVVLTDVARKHSRRVLVDLEEELEILKVVTQHSRAEIMEVITLAMAREFIFMAEITEMVELGSTRTTRTVVKNILDVLSNEGRMDKLIKDIKETMHGIKAAGSNRGRSQNVYAGWRNDQVDQG